MDRIVRYSKKEIFLIFIILGFTLSISTATTLVLYWIMRSPESIPLKASAPSAPPKWSVSSSIQGETYWARPLLSILRVKSSIKRRTIGKRGAICSTWKWPEEVSTKELDSVKSWGNPLEAANLATSSRCSPNWTERSANCSLLR